MRRFRHSDIWSTVIRLAALPIIALGLVLNLTVTHPQPPSAAPTDAVPLPASISVWHSQNYRMTAVPAPRPKPVVRHAQPSRDEQRTPVHAVSHLVPSGGSPKAYAAGLVGATQFRCLDLLWQRESGWNSHAQNLSSGAYGIPQALPGSKMSSAGSDWRTNPNTQIRWGISYVRERYGSPCAAWAHSQSVGWY